MTRFIAISSMFCLLACCYGQDKQPLNNDYPFRDGIYMTFEEFKGDNPTYGAGEFRIDDVDSTDYDLSKVRKIKVLSKKGKWKRLPVSKIWGLSRNGIPYIHYNGLGSVNHPLAKIEKLTRIDVIGTICMFRLEHQNKTVNTNTFVNQKIHSDRVFVLDMLMDLKSGRIYPFDYHSVAHHIRHDEELTREMEMFKSQINLYDIVFAFNLRHPTYPSPVSFWSE